MEAPDQAEQQRRWQPLEGVDDAEVWVANSNLELNYLLEQQGGLPNGQGICLTLTLGGEIYVHTTSEGITLLDVTDEASWATAIITACTSAVAPRGQYWILDENSLVQLIMGLNPLIDHYRIVLSHEFRVARY